MVLFTLGWAQNADNMADRLTVEQRHKCMSHVRSKNTKPEISLRNILWHLGFRYRLNDEHLAGKPDIVLSRYRTVIFVHGCFWHGHATCKKSSIPKTNPGFWAAKIGRNIERDQEVWRELEAKGWSVIVVWECELEKSRIDETTYNVSSQIIENGRSYQRLVEDRRIRRMLDAEEKRKRLAKKAAVLREIKTVF